MSALQLVDTIMKYKQELGLTIDKISLEYGVSARTINRILAGDDVHYSFIEALLKSLHLLINIGKC